MTSKIKKKVQTAVAIATTLAFSIGSAQAASDELIAAATKEGKVVWYTTMIVDQAVRPIAKAFEEKYPGISVEFSRASSSDTGLKIINEGQAGRRTGDVFDGSGSYTAAKAAGMVEPYTADSAQELDPGARDPDGYWAVANYYFLTAAYNTDLVSADEAPKTYEDLLDPKWKGKMVWSVVSEPTGAPGFAGNMLMSKGEDAGMDYLKKLADQDVVNMTTSQRTVLDKVILGEFPVGLMTFNHHIPISKAKGAPVEWIAMEPLVSSASLVGLIKDAPHPNAGKLLIDFILSQEGQKVIASAGYLPSHPKVAAKVPSLMPNGPKPYATTFMSPKTVEENLKPWIKTIDDLFL